MRNHDPFHRFIRSLAAVCIASGFGAIQANDTAFGDANGTIEFARLDSIRMQRERLDISQDSIQVDYEFLNTSSKDTTVSITFPMPARYYGPADHTGIEDFRIWAEGKRLQPEHRLVVLLDDSVDITARIRNLGWSEADMAAYLESGEAPANKKRLPKRWIDKDGAARFTLNDHYTWSQLFPAGKPVSIRHIYKPSVTTGVPNSADDLASVYGRSSCLDKSFLARAKKLETPKLGVSWARLEYILVTANNWQGPIQDFTLRLHKRKPDDLISLCLDGEIRKVDPTTFEFHATDFRPSRNLDVLFAGKLDL